MKNKLKITLLLTLLLASVCCLCTACGAKKEPDGAPSTAQDTDSPTAEESAPVYEVLSEGSAAPDFTASLADKTTFTLSEQSGKIVLLNFWATWCGPCVREMPAFERLREDYGEDVVVLAVNSMEAEDIVDAFIEENGYTFPIAYDVEGAIGVKYPTQGIPYTLVIDGEGIVRDIYLGAADADTQYQEYKKAIDALLE